MKRRTQGGANEVDNEPQKKKTRTGGRAHSPMATATPTSIAGATSERKTTRSGTIQPAEPRAFQEHEDEDRELEDDQSGDELSGELLNGGPKSLNGTTPLKGRNGNKLFSTPRKANSILDADGTPRLQRNPNRSARRKSTRTFIERTVLGNTSDNDDEEDELAQHIYDSADDEELEHDDTDVVVDPATPSKRGRGRAKGSKTRIRSPTPPGDLPPHELYFSQNRPGRSKTANSNLASLALLDHEEYFSLLREYTDPHEDNVKFLQDLHAKSFDEWQFELSQSFNICIYGWGSKRNLLLKFAEAVYRSQTDHTKNKIVVINGYVQNLTVRDIFNTVAAAVSESGLKLGSHHSEMLERLFALLDEDKDKHITLVVHSIDRPALRRPATQISLSRLCSHPQIHLVASADHPSFPLLWDSSLRSTFNFLFHDCTTFMPYTVETEVVDEVHELLGRSGRRPGGKDGVSFVLKSLPENAKNLFRVLIGEQLAAMDDKLDVGFADDDNADGHGHRTFNSNRSGLGVEYRVLYQKAVEEFICSNEMNFRTLLKEFHDHQMIQSRKDALGTEILSVPFRKEELENILEDIV